MTPERYQRIGQLFDEALEHAPEERAAYLEKVCGADVALREEVEKLLAHHVASGKFLSRPALNVAAELLAHNHSTLKPGSQVGHYRIVSMLGAGGMGEVYLAEDARLKRKVALKVLPDMLARDKDRLRRFEQEALAASALNHPNILTIYEFGAVSTEAGEMQVLASEYIDGETLRARLQRAPLALDEALDIAVQTAQALVAAHGAGIIHRDLKPENLMLRNDGIVKVLDFGLAKLVRLAPLDNEAETLMQGLTEVGAVMGTAAYMSPEQARGKPLAARSDIFSLGVVLYEMLASRHPFMGETASHTMVAILEKEPPPLAGLVKDLPDELEEVIRRMLAKNPDERYKGAQQLLADLKGLQKRLELAAELARASSATLHNEAQTQIFANKTSEAAAAPTAAAAGATTGAISRPVRPWLLVALAFALLLGVLSWQWLRPKSGREPAEATASLSERGLTYSLTVQKYRDGKPYQDEFQSSGREIFEPGWRFKLNFVSPQAGFLYLLNQEPGGNFRLLFPLPSRNNGSARLGAGERLQTDWYVFDDQPGTEQFRVIWAAESVPELERFRGLMTPTVKGLISAPADIQVVNDFLQQHAASPVEEVQDRQSDETRVRGRGAVLVTLVKLEHH